MGAAVPTIEESARQVGAWVWAERRLYEVVGAWCPSTVDPAAKIFFSSASQHHAWRAELWQERLPGRLVAAYPPAPGDSPPGSGHGPDGPRDSSGLPGDGPLTPAQALVRPPSAGADALMGALAGLNTDGARLGAYCRVILPRTLVAYRSWQRRCSPSADRPVARALAISLSDVATDWQDGCEVFTALVGGAGGGLLLEEAAAASLRVERLVAGPGSAGPGSASPGSAGPGSAGPGSAGAGSAGSGRGEQGD